MKLGLLTAAFPDLSLEQVAEWAASEGLRDARDRLLAGGRRRAASLRRRLRTSTSTTSTPTSVRGVLERHGLELSSLAYYPNNLHPDDGAARGRVNAHLRKVIDAAERLGVRLVGTFVGNDKDRPLPENLERFRGALAAARRVRRRARREDRDRELPDDLLVRRVAGRQQPRLVAGDLGRAVLGHPGRELRPQPRPLAPRVADDRLRARGLRLRRPHLPRAREGPGDPARRALPARHPLERRSAGRCRGSPGSARCAGTASSRRSTPSATTTCSRSSTRIGASRATEELVKRGFLLARNVLRPRIV